MKNLLLSMLFIVGTSSAFANTESTDLTTGWVCTTNASSSDVSTDKAADDQMENTTSTAVDSFALAAKNCRDCTTITCEVKDD